MTTTAIKFYYNGIRINGSKNLIKCYYSMDNDNRINGESVTIYARNYGDELPRDLFCVENGTDTYTDYFETDSTTITPEHPLYKFARYAAECAKIKELEHYISYTEKKIKEQPGFYARDDYYKKEVANRRARLEVLRNHQNPGQPTAADLEAVAALNSAAESARIAAEHAEQIAEREKVLKARHEGRVFIEQQMQKFPIEQGAPVVRIQWSESPAFAPWGENELVLSVAAAETILAHYDAEKAAENGGYDKTSFCIEWNDESGEPCTYEGRYDLGDNEGGLIAHIRNFGACGYGMTDDERAECAAFVEMLTDEQLEAAVFAIDPNDQDHIDVARFFLQALTRRDEKKALDVFRRWRKSEPW